MPVHMQIDDYSFSAIKVRPFFNELVCSEAATAFCWAGPNNRLYLITNWHVVSGRSSVNGANLDPMGMRPNRLLIAPHAGAQAQPLEIEVRLFADNVPTWLEHPTHGRLVDVAAVEIDPGVLHDWRPTNALPAAELAVIEGDDLFILGFPDGLTGGINFPIWKRGTISSLPELDQEGLPYFLVDTASGPGMSGSPVIRRDRLPPVGGEVEYIPGTNQPRARTQPTKFVGTYSGRLGETGVRATLGRVWRAEVVAEVIAGERRGEI